MDSVFFWLAVSVLLVATFLWMRRGSRRRREVQQVTTAGATNQASTQRVAAIRVLRDAPPVAVPARIRVISRATGGAGGSPQPAMLADLPPAHALCTHCQRPFSSDPAERARYGGEHRCPECGSYTHGNCYIAKGRRCGGICAM